MGVSEEIVRKLDEIAPRIKDDILILLGETKYVPKNCKYLRSVPSIVPFIRKSKLVISHGGAGTLFECLDNGVRVIAIAKKHADDHQTDIINKLSIDGYIIKCNDLEKLEYYISSNHRLKKYRRLKCGIPDAIMDFIEKE